MSPPPEIDRPRGDLLSVAIIGNDAVLAALPAHPVQLAHGCHLLGYHAVVPASWGDELVADTVLQSAERLGRQPAIVCACDLARSRLTNGWGGLQPFLISTISPPVAAARHLRAMLTGRRLDITFVGDCVSGADPVFDARFSPDVFLVRLRSAGIDLKELPAHFDNLVPPDRRRFASLPGGCPAPEALARRCPDRELIELADEDLVTELAQQLLAQDAVLLDVATGVGCACTGVRRSASSRTARVAVMSLEPPRSLQPIIEGKPLVDLSAGSTPPALVLLPRDPSADLIQSELPHTKPGEAEPHEPDFTPGSDFVADTAAASLQARESVRRSRPPVATTPPRALRGVRSTRSTPLSATMREPSRSTVRATENPVGLAPSDDEQNERTRVGLAVAAPVPTAPAVRPAVDGRTMSHRRARVGVGARRPHALSWLRQDLLRQVLLWTAIAIASGLLALAIVARSR